MNGPTSTCCPSASLSAQPPSSPFFSLFRCCHYGQSLTHAAEGGVWCQEARWYVAQEWCPECPAPSPPAIRRRLGGVERNACAIFSRLSAHVILCVLAAGLLEEPHDTFITGLLLLLGTFVFFVVGMYSVVVAKWMPETGHPFLDFLRTDDHYSLLVPLLIPVLVVTAYFNWLGMKFFRHNT